MLYVFHGEIKGAGDKARALVDSLRTKRPDAAYEYIQADTWDASAVSAHLGGQGLFSNKYIIFLDRVTEDAEAKDELPGLVVALQESPNIFIILEGKLNAELKKAVEKSAEKVVEVEKKTVAGGAAPSEGPNVFALAGAVGQGDALKAWMLYRESVDSGAALEAILGMLFWKAKSSMNKELASKVLTLYHDGHRGLRDLELGTERLILSLRP